MIYLASPYSHPDHAVRESRYRTVRDVVWNSLPDVVYFSPVLYCHHMALELDLPFDHVPYEALNKNMLRRSETIHILMLDGWMDSTGINYERRLAERLDMPIKFLTYSIRTKTLTEVDEG